MSAASSRRTRLERLDDRVVPVLQRMARAVARPVTAPARALRALDRRIAGGRFARSMTEHRGLVAMVVVLVGFGATLVHFQRYPRLQEEARRAAEQTVREVGGGEGTTASSGGPTRLAGGAVAVGPVLDARVEPYLEDRRSALAAVPADQDVVAVVSFTDFLGPEAIAGLLPEGLDVRLAQYQLPERDPRPAELEVVNHDLAASVDNVVGVLVDDIRAEEAAVESTLKSGVSDDEFRRDYEARLDELKAMRNVLATDPEIVFAVVVQGRAGALQSLADSADVRLVDPAPAEIEVDTSDFFGVLPTDRDRFSFGRRA